MAAGEARVDLLAVGRAPLTADGGVLAEFDHNPRAAAAAAAPPGAPPAGAAEGSLPLSLQR